MIKQLKTMPVDELQNLLDRLGLMDSIQAATFLGLSPATMRNPRNQYKKFSISIGQYLFWRKEDLEMAAPRTIKFNYIRTYDESGPVRASGQITIDRYGRQGWSWNNSRTNEEGRGLWENEQQQLGTMQFSLSRNSKQALYKLAKREASFNSVNGKFEDLQCEYTN